MELRTKLRSCIVISVLALVLKIVVYVSPGWAVVKTDIEVAPKDFILPENDGLHVDYPLENMPPEKYDVSIQFGIWYYKVCMKHHDKDDDDHDSSEEKDDHPMDKVLEDDQEQETRTSRHHDKKRKRHCKCYHRCYRGRGHHHKKHHHPEDKMMMMDKDNEESHIDVPAEFAPAKDFITTSVEFARHGRLDLAGYLSVGLILAVVGTIAAVFYARGGGIGKHSGRLACTTQVLSTFFFWMVIIRTGTYLVQLNAYRKHYMLEDDEVGDDVKFIFPWCLAVGAVATLIMDLSALFHLILVSRDRRFDGTCYEPQSKTASIFATKEVPYFTMKEEAGPLPEKQPIT